MSKFCDFLDGLDTGPCGKLFKKSVIKQNNIMFDEFVHMGEDTIFLYDYLTVCNIIASVEDSVYYINGLIEESLSRDKYHENLAENMHRCVQKYREVFREERNSYTFSSIEKTTLRLFKISNMHYIACLRNRPEICVKKIQETKELFSDDLKQVSMQRIGEIDKNFVEKIFMVTKADDINVFFKEEKMNSTKKYILKYLGKIRIWLLWGVNAIL